MEKEIKTVNGIKSFIHNNDIDGNNKKYQKMYDKIAPLYNFSNKIYFWLKFKGEANYRNQFLSELEIKEGDKVLEVSCGTGDNFPFLPKNIELHGLDISMGMLKSCQKHLKRWGLQAQLYHAPGEKLPFDDEMFDVVYHVGGINFFNDRKKAIEEMIRVAKKGTKIVIVDETEKLAKNTYEKIPLVGTEYKNREEIVAPVHFIPKDMEDIQVKEICKGLMYCLSFRKPNKY
jgi:ubiquinone/menaquinone biosynthesis C-methylase UbiE